MSIEDRNRVRELEARVAALESRIGTQEPAFGMNADAHEQFHRMLDERDRLAKAAKGAKRG